MTYNLFGRPVSSPILKLAVIVLAVTWSILTLPLHCIIWCLNGRGFIKYDKRGLTRNYQYEPPAWAAILALAYTAAIVVWLV